ncbi:MAG: hypothetical protein KGO50_18425, partial [Myxococcales bacterium]|nr:hypothetical protein [Myxococcales bacterium]
QGTVTVSVPANESIAVFTQGTCTVSRLLGFPNYPTSASVLGTVSNGQTVFGPYTTGADIVLDASGGVQVLYEVGVSPVVQQQRLLAPVQVTPGVLNATGTLTAVLCLTGLVTSTTAAGVTATLDTGATVELASNWAINDSFDWAVINTGPNTFTVTAAASGHTVVGAGAVATGTSGQFRTRKTATDTFVTYRLG